MQFLVLRFDAQIGKKLEVGLFWDKFYTPEVSLFWDEQSSLKVDEMPINPFTTARHLSSSPCSL